MMTGFQQQQPWRLTAPVRSAPQPQHGARWPVEPQAEAEPKVFTERTPPPEEGGSTEDR